MAVAEDFDTKTSGADDWLSCADSAMKIVGSSLTEAPFSAAVEAIDRYRSDLSAIEALLIAQRKGAGHSDRATEGIIKSSGGVSKGEAKKRTKRADAVAENPTLAKKMTSGELSTEKVDLLADASSKTDGAAASDPALIKEIANANPDQGRAIARKFVDDHQSPTDRNTRYRWQRDRRKVYKSRAANGMSQLIMEGDDETIDGALRAIRKRSDASYRRDGGRGVASDEHDRTHDQRMFDAAAAQLMGRASDDAAAPAEGDSSQATDATPAGTGSSSPAGSGPTPAPPASSPRGCSPPANRPGERPTMIFTAKLSDITDDPDLLREWEAELVGTGLVPTPVASYFRCISDHAAQLLSETGEVLWQGRARRRVTMAQWTALVARDAGCVLCQADHTMCEAHHLIPWNAPAKGETNIDEMALVCVDCHHRIHDNDQTLYRDAESEWRLRSATVDEIAPLGRKPRPDPRATRRNSKTSAATKSVRRTDQHAQDRDGARPGRSPNSESRAPNNATDHAPLDEYENQTENGTVRHDLFDWLE